jgi:hypothetical protein
VDAEAIEGITNTKHVAEFTSQDLQYSTNSHPGPAEPKARPHSFRQRSAPLVVTQLTRDRAEVRPDSHRRQSFEQA